MTREQDERAAGLRPIVKEDSSGYPAYTTKYQERVWVAAYHENKSIYRLPGQGEQTHDDCGEWKHPVKCVHQEQTTLECKKHDVFVIQKHCYSPDCPVCYEAWSSRQAENTTDRLFQAAKAWRSAGLRLARIDHVTFSPPQEWAKELIRTKGGARTLRSKATEIIRKAGIQGAVLVFHPFRQNSIEKDNYNPDIPDNAWYESPHFHVIGCGFLMRSDNFYQLTRWTYTKMEKRKIENIKSTVKYTLTHCGIADGFQAVTYIGLFSNNKVVIDKEWVSEEPILCSACNEPLHYYGWKETGAGLEPDYTDDKGVYLHKVKHRIYKIRDAVLKAYRDSLEASQEKGNHQGYIRIDDRPIQATKSRIKDIIRLMKDGC